MLANLAYLSECPVINYGYEYTDFVLKYSAKELFQFSWRCVVPFFTNKRKKGGYSPMSVCGLKHDAFLFIGFRLLTTAL